ncbi:MAG: cupin domain-containing protein [Euryarchaeota archaeon]|nr:cupin domain-containing protein [Euryarchaeota archaeon]
MQDIIVRKKGESQRTISIGGNPTHLLTKSEVLESMLVEMDPGKGIPRVYSHEGEEVRIVLEGQLEIEVAGKKYHLQKGDTMWFKSKLPHKVSNPSKEKTVYFAVSVPPTLTW